MKIASRIILIFLTLLLATTEGKATKAVARRFDITLNDGTKTTVVLKGDEYCHFFLSKEGEIILREQDGWRRATATEEEEIRQTHEALLRSRQQLTILDEPSTTVPFTLPEANKPFPHSGTPKALVILLSLADQSLVYSREEVDNLLNAEEYTPYENGVWKSYGSAAQYFSDCSYGKFRPQFDVVGPYTLENPTSYYGSNFGGSDKNVEQLVEDACKKAEENGLNFSQYDQNNDGYIDLVYVFYAGYGEDYGGGDNFLWPCSGFFTSNTTYGGKKIFRYGISAELFGYPGVESMFGVEKPILRGISTFVHEMGHTIGLTDVYPTVSWSKVTSYDNQSMEDWDIMDNGTAVCNGYYPTPYTAWEREWLGWTEEMGELKTPGHYSLLPLSEGGRGMRIYNPNDITRQEFYVLENIPDAGRKGWYAFMPGNGLLVTHINYSSTFFANFNNPNNAVGQPRWTIIPANGTLYSSYRSFEQEGTQYYMSNKELEESYLGNTYPGAENVTSLTAWREYTPTMPFSLANISSDENGVISFDFLDNSSGIEHPSHDSVSMKRAVFSLDGRRIDADFESLGKGVYIVDGKKVVK